MMFCQSKPKKMTLRLVFLVGLISLAYGLIGGLTTPEGTDSTHLTMMGMFSGAGTGLVAVAIISWLRCRYSSPEKLKQRDIEQRDERNITISRAAYTVMALVGAGSLAVLTFVFMGLGYRVPAYVCLGCLYLQLLAYLLSVRFYQKRM